MCGRQWEGVCSVCPLLMSHDFPVSGALQNYCQKSEMFKVLPKTRNALRSSNSSFSYGRGKKNPCKSFASLFRQNLKGGSGVEIIRQTLFCSVLSWELRAGKSSDVPPPPLLRKNLKALKSCDINEASLSLQDDHSSDSRLA